ncbi:methyltransferase [Pokkaliibacter plantistimulans]|uniref:methyltransferase n=1 Tax=Pokkaliibacter plantistimulans TaxID=1635171 RepID=UPI000D7452DC|nr:methyltransferase [Pokkaliibacter plantistimulans]
MTAGLQADNTTLAQLARLQLSRFPENDGSELLPYDAADSYLLEQLQLLLPDWPQRRILVINDQFGALTLSLAVAQPTSVTDSFLAQQGCLANARINSLATPAVQSVLQPLEGRYDAVLWRLPKSLAYMQDQIQRLIAPHSDEQTLLLAGGMVKHWANGHFAQLALLGDVQKGLAVRKARVVQIVLQHEKLAAIPEPTLQEYTVADYGVYLREYANVFSQGHLDIGSRFLLENLHRLTIEAAQPVIADLGCGNGILGVLAGRRFAEAELHFYDESFMALATAELSAEANLPGRERYHFHAGDGLAEVTPGSVDVVLNNPPFHQQQVVGDHIARRMFTQAHQALRDQGVLWVVANRHLGYHQRLQQLFGNVRQIAGNPKFVLLEAVKDNSYVPSRRFVEHDKGHKGQQQRNRQHRRPAAKR